MALPPGISAKTVTIGIASFFDGSLADGVATITAPVNVIHTPSNRPIFSSVIAQRFVDGTASFNLAPTDAAGLNRVDWSYKLNVMIQGALVQPDPIYFTLPTAGPDTVDLDGLVTVPSSAGIPISVEVLTADELDPYTADFVNDPTSATSTALRAALDPSAGMEVRDRFADYAEGSSPTRAATGQPYIYDPTTGNRHARIVGGKLTMVETTGAGSYTMVQLNAAGQEIGATATFSSYTTSGGVLCLAFFSDAITETAGHVNVTDASVHFTFGPTGWQFNCFQAGVEVDPGNASGTFSPALAADGTTAHTASVVLDRANATAYLTLPDGTKRVVTHPLIGSLDSRFATIEPFRLNGSTDSLASIVEWWASSRVPERLADQRWALSLASPPIVAFSNPASRQTVTLTSSAQEVAADLRHTFQMPPSGRVVVELTCQARIAAASWLIASLFTDAALTANVGGCTVWGGDNATAPAHEGPVRGQWIYTANPGLTVTLYFGISAPAGSGSVIVDPSFGFVARTAVSAAG